MLKILTFLIAFYMTNASQLYKFDMEKHGQHVYDAKDGPAGPLKFNSSITFFEGVEQQSFYVSFVLKVCLRRLKIKFLDVSQF